MRALFVRSFPNQLSLTYLEGPNVKIYIRDSSKDLFYELENLRTHLNEIKDRTVLRIFELKETPEASQVMARSRQFILPNQQQYFYTPSQYDSLARGMWPENRLGRLNDVPRSNYGVIRRDQPLIRTNGSIRSSIR